MIYSKTIRKLLSVTLASGQIPPCCTKLALDNSRAQLYRRGLRKLNNYLAEFGEDLPDLGQLPRDQMQLVPISGRLLSAGRQGESAAALLLKVIMWQC